MTHDTAIKVDASVGAISFERGAALVYADAFLSVHQWHLRVDVGHTLALDVSFNLNNESLLQVRCSCCCIVVYYTHRQV